MIREKTHDKRKFKKCKYSANVSGVGARNSIMCDYSKTGRTCLRMDPITKEITDIRGDDPKNCLLFAKGKKGG